MKPRTQARSVTMYPAHWKWLDMRSKEFQLPTPRILRILVELDHKNRILDNTVIQRTTTHDEQHRKEGQEGDGHEPSRTAAGEQHQEPPCEVGDVGREVRPEDRVECEKGKHQVEDENFTAWLLKYGVFQKPHHDKVPIP